MRATRLLLVHLPLLAILIVLAGCSDPVRIGNGTVIVGLSSELQPGVDIDGMHVVMRAGEDVIRDEVDTLDAGTLRLPVELPFADLPDATPVEIEIEVYRVGDSSTPLLTRAASSEVIGDRTLLLRVRLERECVIPPGGQACPAPLTCVAGGCSDAHIDPARLEEYTPSWADKEPDACKPLGAGAPVVIVGEGQADYLPLDDLQEVQVEAGPQGGHHIWMAVRMKNLRQSGSITSISGQVPDLGASISPFNVIFTFDQDEGGYCKLYGLRFQLDGALDIQTLLGKVVDVTVQVSDTEGDVGTGSRSVTLSQTIL